MKQDYIYVKDAKVIETKDFSKYDEPASIAVYHRDENHPEALVYVRVAEWNTYSDEEIY